MKRHLPLLLAVGIFFSAPQTLFANHNQCGILKPVKSGFHKRTLTHDKQKRAYTLYVPKPYDPKTSTPLVMNLHGRGGNGKGQIKLTKLHNLADKEGFLVVAPNGIKNSWNAGVLTAYAYKHNIDDVGFLRTVLDEVEGEFCVDPNRIFVTGFSNGSRMSQRLACELSTRIAAIAPIGGPIAETNQDKSIRAFTCKPERPVPVFMLHGKKDKCSPYEGGGRENGISVEEAINGWKIRNQCKKTKPGPYQTESVTCVEHTECKQNASVILCTMPKGGHVWPGKKKYFGWRTCGGKWIKDFNLTEAIWTFFQAHPRNATRAK